MAAAVMTRPSSTKPGMSSSGHKARINIPPRLQLGNGAGAASSRDSLPSLSPSSISSSSEGRNSRNRSSSHTGSGGRATESRASQHRRDRERDDGKRGEGRGGGVRRERSSRLVLNGELVESQLSPRTQESIFQVFSFNTRAADFEESVSQVWPQRCSFVVKELIETERAYVEALGDIIKGYISPLYGYLLSSGDGPNFIRTVFCNIVKIHRYHLELLNSLQSLCSQPRQLAQVFIDRDFGLYTEYCTNYSKGNEYLEQSLATSSDLQTFILDCQSKLDHSLPLHSHLIKPVQRILKYPLLLEELVKNFDESHVAYSTVEEACRKMTEVAEHINSSFQKPAKKKSLAPSAIARIRSKEVEGLQRRRTMIPVSPNSPTSIKFLTQPGRSKRSISMEPGEVGTADRVHMRRSHRRRNRKKQARRHMSVEDLYPDELATASSSEDDHLARVRDLKSFFENLNASETATNTPVLEVAPLERSKLSVFENPGDCVDERKGEKHSPEEMHGDWPSVRKTSCKFGSPSHSLTSSSSSSSGKASGKEQGTTGKSSVKEQGTTGKTSGKEKGSSGKSSGKAKGSKSKRDS